MSDITSQHKRGQNRNGRTIGKRTERENPNSSSFSSPSLRSATSKHRLENERRALMPSSSPCECISLDSMLCFSMLPMTFWYQLVLLRSSRCLSNGRTSNSGSMPDRRSHCSATEDAALFARKPEDDENKTEY